MKRITIPEIRQHPWFQHKLPPYLRHAPEIVEKQERMVDAEVIEEVLRLPFKGMTREIVDAAAASSDKEVQGLSKLVRDLRVAYVRGRGGDARGDRRRQRL